MTKSKCMTWTLGRPVDCSTGWNGGCVLQRGVLLSKFKVSGSNLKEIYTNMSNSRFKKLFHQHFTILSIMKLQLYVSQAVEAVPVLRLAFGMAFTETLCMKESSMFFFAPCDSS